MEAGIERVRADPRSLLLGPYETIRLAARVDCRLQLLNEPMLPSFVVLALRNGSDYVDHINDMRVQTSRATNASPARTFRISNLVESGLIDMWARAYGQQAAKPFDGPCHELGSAVEWQTSARLLTPLGVGLVISALALGGERARVAIAAASSMRRRIASRFC